MKTVVPPPPASSTSVSSATIFPNFCNSQTFVVAGTTVLALSGVMGSNHDHQERQRLDDSIQVSYDDLKLHCGTLALPDMIVTNVTTSARIVTILVNGDNIAAHLRDKIPGGIFELRGG